jgi:hypothetical protein
MKLQDEAGLGSNVWPQWRDLLAALRSREELPCSVKLTTMSTAL